MTGRLAFQGHAGAYQREGDMGAARFQVRRNKLTRRYRVVLLADNGEPLTTSETLNSVAAVNKNIQATIDAVANVKHIDWPD